MLFDYTSRYVHVDTRCTIGYNSIYHYEMPTLKAGKTQGGPVFLLRMPVWLRPKCHSRRWLNLHMRLVSHVSHPNAIHVQACVLQWIYLSFGDEMAFGRNLPARQPLGQWHHSCTGGIHTSLGLQVFATLLCHQLCRTYRRNCASCTLLDRIAALAI